MLISKLLDCLNLNTVDYNIICYYKVLF